MSYRNFPRLRGGEGSTSVAVLEDSNWVVLQYPPAIRWLSIWSCPFKLPFVLPFVVFFIRFSRIGDTYRLHGIHAFFMRKPLDDSFDTLYVPFLPHFTVKEGLCNGDLNIEGTRLLQTAVGLVGDFWSRGFGLKHLRWRDNIEPSDWRVHNPYRWLLFTLLTPDSVLELEMISKGSVSGFLSCNTNLYTGDMFEVLIEEVTSCPSELEKTASSGSNQTTSTMPPPEYDQ